MTVLKLNQGCSALLQSIPRGPSPQNKPAGGRLVEVSLFNDKNSYVLCAGSFINVILKSAHIITQ